MSLKCYFANSLVELPDFNLQSFEIEYAINAIPYAVVVFDVTHSAANQKNLEATRSGVDVTLKLEGKAVFKGVVTRQQVSLRLQTLRITLTLRHWLFALTLGRESRVFGGPGSPPIMTDNLIVMQVLADRIGSFGLLEAVTVGLTADHVQLVQHDQSDWHFVRARVAANRAWCVPTVEGYRIEPPSVPVPGVVSAAGALVVNHLTFSSQGVRALDWRFADEGRDKVSATAWSVAEQMMAPAPKMGSNLPFGLLSLNAYDLPMIADRGLSVSRSAPLRPLAQQALADGMQMARQLEAVQGTVTFDGSSAHLGYQLAKMATIIGVGPRLDGTAPITSIRHVGDAKGWTTSVGVGLERPLSDVITPHSNVATSHIGVVLNYPQPADPNFQVAVKIPAIGPDPLWARLASPLASMQSGLYLFPEVGDEVLLQFLDGDLSYPVIVGSLYSARKPVPAAYFPKTGAPVARGLRVLGQGELVLDAEGVSLESPKKVSVVALDELLVKGTPKTTIVGQAVDFKQT